LQIKVTYSKMAAPSLFDGISRAIEELAIPSIVLLTVIVGIRITYGGREAGITYVVLTVVILLGIYTAAKYWNVRYTAGFVAAGLLVWFVLPGVIPQLIPDLFTNLSKLIVLMFLVSTGLMLTDKWG
jgi:hypothetical protein